jgi:undecaprenyl pyrophosphate phosphatase UppP
VDAPNATLSDRLRAHRVTLGVIVAVLVIWLVGAAVTRFSLEQMALLAPIAVVVVGLTVGLILLWVKIVLQLRAERRRS